MSRGERNGNGNRYLHRPGPLRYVQERLQFFAPPPEQRWFEPFATADENVIRIHDPRFSAHAIAFGQAYASKEGTAVPVSSWYTLQRPRKKDQWENCYIFYDEHKGFYFVEKIPVDRALFLDVEVPSFVWPTRPA